MVFAAVLFSGCTALDENPTTSLSKAAVYSTESGLESLLVGCYQQFKGSDMLGGRLYEYLQNGSLLIHWKGDRTQSSFQQGLDLTMYSTDQYNQQCFTSHYCGINRCNSLIDNLPDSPVNKDYKTEVEAEAKLLRAVYYYTAVRMWGDLPLAIHSATSLENGYLPRSSYIDVYKLILEDLNFAEENMRDKNRQKQINGDTNRCDKWCATAFKACVYLQIGCILSSPDDQPFSSRPDFTSCGIADADAAFKLALETADNVIKNGPYKLADKYTDLFRWTNPEDFQLTERIFVIPSTNGSGGQTSFCQYTLPEYMDGTANTSAKANNWGRTRPERMVFQKWAKTYGGELDTDRVDELTNVYINCKDPRFDATYIYNSYYNLNTGKNVSIYPKDKLVSGIIASKASATFAPYFRKYVNPGYNANNGWADLYILRFAEMYLCAAEASASLSKAVGDKYWEDAFDYIEVLHKRARNTNEGAIMPKWTSDRFETKDELITAIFWERIYEMSGECHEWFDMRRRGAQWTIDNILIPMNEFLQEPEQGIDKTNPVEGSGYWQTSYFSRVFPTDKETVLKGLLCAFPEHEILTNASIGFEDQNKYYFR